MIATLALINLLFPSQDPDLLLSTVQERLDVAIRVVYVSKYICRHLTGEPRPDLVASQAPATGQGTCSLSSDIVDLGNRVYKIVVRSVRVGKQKS
jgi:hypothetical protein